VLFLRWMEQHAELGWFINDLSRAPIPYYAIRVIAKLTRLHPFVQHDAPVSIARSFVPGDWQRMCSAAGFGDNDILIQSFKPARLLRVPHQTTATGNAQMNAPSAVIDNLVLGGALIHSST